MGLAKSAQAANLYSSQLSWLGSPSFYNSLLALFGQPVSNNDSEATPPSTDGNTNTGGNSGTGTPGGSTGSTPPSTDGNTNTGGNSGTGTPGGSTGSTPPSTGGNTNTGGNGTSTTPVTTAEKNYQKYLSHYQAHEVPIVDAYRANYDGSLAQAMVGRAIWYMEHGYMVYGHHKYWDTGYIDCSNFVSLVYKDFGYSITSAARKYNTVGTKVEGVYAKKQSNGKYTLVGVDKLRPGDIFTYWNTDENGKYISHVALYMGVVNGKPAIINTRKEHPTAIGIIDSFSYWYGEQLLDVRRVLPESAFTPNSGVKLSNPVIPAVYQLKPQNPIVMPKDLPKGF